MKVVIESNIDILIIPETKIDSVFLALNLW